MIKFLPSTYRQIENKQCDIEPLKNIFVLKYEKFAVQIELKLEEDIWVRLNENSQLPWNGLVRNFRVEFVKSEYLDGQLYFEQAVLDDDGVNKKDRLIRSESEQLSAGYHNLWLDLKALKSGTTNITINIYSSENFEDEVLIHSSNLAIEISNIEINNNNIFFLDLWQHLSSIARYYNVRLFSKRHFELIENFLKPLANAGQKVCNLIVSDYSWAGQSCYNIVENKSSLYEYNIVDVKISDKDLILDFTAFDKYLKLCEKLGMAEEINIFGLIGNWKDKTFGSPIENYEDPIRIRAYDVQNKKFIFIKDAELVKQYIYKICQHITDLGIVAKTKIMADQPKTANSISVLEDLILSYNKEIKFKYAIKDSGFFEKYQGDTESFSIILYEYLKERNKNYFKNNIEKMTWYVCWKPLNLNQFIRSPLIESRLVGYYTYLFNLKGFLRWNYCLWTNNPNADIRYRSDRWPAGDMFFVYPGKDGLPDESLRFKQLTYGIQDYNFLKYCETKLSKDTIIEIIKKITGNIDDLNYNVETTQLTTNYVGDYSLLNNIKKELVLKLTKEIKA